MLPSAVNTGDSQTQGTVLEIYPVLARLIDVDTSAHSARQPSVELVIRARLYRTLPDSALRSKIMRRLAVTLGIKLDEDSYPLFAQRIRPFLAESLARIPLIATIEGQDFPLGKTRTNGNLHAKISIPSLTNNLLPKLTIRSDRPSTQEVATTFIIVPRRGLSVISDIDATIKISNVHEKRELLIHTFTGNYIAVPGMADAYQNWKLAGITFHYISATPWQLYGPLSHFLEGSGFPCGTYHLRQFRTKDRSAASMLRPSRRVKYLAACELISLFPERCFALVGDSTEGDPLLYAQLQKLFPDQIVQVIIRDTGRNTSIDRAFRLLTAAQRSRWQTFDSPTDISSTFVL